jgi:hypothetical protein
VQILRNQSAGESAGTPDDDVEFTVVVHGGLQD